MDTNTFRLVDSAPVQLPIINNLYVPRVESGFARKLNVAEDGLMARCIVPRNSSILWAIRCCLLSSAAGTAVLADEAKSKATASQDQSVQAVKSDEVGQPVRLEVFPEAIHLASARQSAQIVITGHYADSSVRDLTGNAKISSTNAKIFALRGTAVVPTADGSAEVSIEVGGLRASIPVKVSDYAKVERIAFENGALVALSKQGCNSGACHGSPSGKGGFRLSLRAFDPKLDELTLIREDFGRRTNALDPDKSLLLQKPVMKVAHGGGLQISKNQPAYAVLRDWIAEGGQADPPNYARCVKLEVYPSKPRVLVRPARTQQFAVVAHFSDGTKRDVTQLAAYSTSDEEIASISVDGLVTGNDRGEIAVLVRYLEHIESVNLTFVKEVEGFEWKNPPTNNYVDELVYSKLRQLRYLPSETCTDSEFIRRIYLDVIGILPTIDETHAFLESKSATKRSELIDSLLKRPEFPKFWALKWGDLLRLTSSQVGVEGVHKYHRWVERAIEENMPYDKFARALLTSSGSTLENPPASFYRTSADMNDRVETVSQIFLGARLQCAKCHNHPFERWTQDNYYGMGAFFNRVQKKKTLRPDENFVYTSSSGEVTQPRTGQQMKPWLPGVGSLQEITEQDRRHAFADWLTSPNNPYFARIEANRLWSQLFSRGIVDPIDDFRDSNPPSNKELLDKLAEDFVKSGFDRKHILRVILNSRTYQASYQTNKFNAEDTKCFSHQEPRLLGAEQLLDAICHVTDVPEQFAALPATMKATQLPAPDLVKNDFLKVFGQPERQTVCACERASESNLGMAIQFFNGPLIYNKLRHEKNRFRQLMALDQPNHEIIRQLYLAAVCRLPSDKELIASLQHIESKQDRAAALEDVCWSLLNTNEFLFQH